MVQLDVDSEVNHVVGPLNPKAIDHREPVFIGGVPGKYLATLFSNFNKESIEAGEELFNRVCNDRTRGNVFKRKENRF